MTINRWAAAAVFVAAALLAVALPALPGLLKQDPYYGWPIPGSQQAVLWQDEVAGEGVHTFVMLGFLDCTDTCPSQLATLVKLDQLLAGVPVRFHFLSLAPEMDSPERLTSRVVALGPRFDWSRPASLEQARALASELGEWVAAAPLAAGHQELSHAGHVYLVAPSGRPLLAYRGGQLDPIRMQHDVLQLLAKEPR